MQRPTLTVSEVNRYIKDILSTNIILSNVMIVGEISNYKNHYSGHRYFTLKDENSAIRCVMFKSSCMNLKFAPENGMKVIIQGRISVYEKDGSYQLYANDMQPDGIGALHIAFEQLKKKLELEGLFNTELKKIIPFLPKSIGVVTSPTGAAIRDIINVISRRFYNINVIIYPVQVQGNTAASQIANAINNFNTLDTVDVIIIGRGGGSIEELWAFNEEIVARSIANSNIPIISGVGHETDFTISDFVADLRAPTPSAAAELVVPNKSDIQFTLNTLNTRLKYAIESIINKKITELQSHSGSLNLRHPKDRILQNRLYLDTQTKLLINALERQFKKNEQKFSQLIAKLSSLSPLSILQRGYCVPSVNSNIIKSVKNIKAEQNINLRFVDGSVDCKVIKVNKEEL